MAEEGQGVTPPPPRNINETAIFGETFMPTRVLTGSCIVLPANANTFTPRANNIQILPSYHGMENENPYTHLQAFVEACSICLTDKVNEDIVYLKLFPFSLKDRAKHWFITLQPQSIHTWLELQSIFLKNFFTENMTHSVKQQIQNFQQKASKSFQASLERFKDLLVACPHHGFNLGGILGFFYQGCTSETRRYIETMCNGTFFRKTWKDAWDYLEEISEHEKRFGNNSEFDRSLPTAGNNGGIYRLGQEQDIQARVDAEVTRRMKGMVPQTSNFVDNNLYCAVCERVGHETNACPALPALKETIRTPKRRLIGFLIEGKMKIGSKIPIGMGEPTVPTYSHT